MRKKTGYLFWLFLSAIFAIAVIIKIPMYDLAGISFLSATYLIQLLCVYLVAAAYSTLLVSLLPQLLCWGIHICKWIGIVFSVLCFVGLMYGILKNTLSIKLFLIFFALYSGMLHYLISGWIFRRSTRKQRIEDRKNQGWQ